MFLCYYRVKGYVVIFALINVACSLYCIHLLSGIKDGSSNIMSLFAVLTVVYFNQAFIDAICCIKVSNVEGMTSITYRMHNRLREMKPDVGRICHIDGYLLYILVRNISRPLFYLFSTVLTPDDTSKEIAVDKIADQFSYLFIGFSVVSAYIAVHSIFFF